MEGILRGGGMGIFTGGNVILIVKLVSRKQTEDHRYQEKT